MPFIKTDVYTDEQKRAMRLNVCKQCVFISCNGNNSNKCSIETMICTKTAINERVVEKSANLASKCPMDYWTLTNKTLDNYIPKPGCGCHR